MDNMLSSFSGGSRAGFVLLFMLMGLSIQSPAILLSGSEYTIVEREHKKGLVDKHGEIVIPVEYDDLGWSDQRQQLLGNVIGYKRNGLWGLINLKNERLSIPTYTDLIPFNDGLIIGAKKRLYNKEIVYGLINTRGKIQLEFNYYHLKKSGDRLLATVRVFNDFKTGLIDEKAEIYISLDYRWIKPLSSDVYAVANNEKKIALVTKMGDYISGFEMDSVQVLDGRYELVYQDGKTGVFDKSTNMLIQPGYKYIEVDEQGSVRGLRFREWMVTDSANHIINAFQYDRVEPVGNALYKVSIGGAEALIDESDKNLTGFKKIEIGRVFDDIALFCKDHHYGILSLTGKTLVDPLYDTILVRDDFFLVKGSTGRLGGWMLFDRNGKQLTSKAYQDMKPIGGRFFGVRSGGYWGAINGLGNEILICKFDQVDKYLNGRFKVNLLGEDGIINLDEGWDVMPMKKEIELLDCIRYLVRSRYGSYVAYYPKTLIFSAEYFLYPQNELYLEKTEDGKIGLLDAKGIRIIRPIYDEISPLQEDSLYITREGVNYSFITKHGKVLDRLDRRYQEVHGMSDYFIGVKIEGYWGFVDIKGNLRIANRYNNIGPFHEGMAPVKLRGKWGFIDKLEFIKVQPLYDTVYAFQKGLARVKYKGQFGMVTKRGKVVLDYEYDDIHYLETGGYISEKNGKKGLINLAGKALIWPKFEKVVNLNNRHVIVVRNGRYGLMSVDGLSPIPTLYDEIVYDPWKNQYLVARPPEWETLQF